MMIQAPIILNPEAVGDPNQTPIVQMPTFRFHLEQLINAHSMENGSDTPDFILAEYLNNCLKVFDHAVHARSRWYGHHDTIAGQIPQPEGAPTGDRSDGG